MPTIDISGVTLKRLQEQAEPLVDTYDSVIGRLLDLAEGQGKTGGGGVRPKPNARRRAPRGEKTANQAFYGPIAKVLREAGGELPTVEAVDRVGRLMEGALNATDLSVLKSGEPRWRNTVRWARNDLVKSGVLDGNAPHGTWRLSRGRGT